MEWCCRSMRRPSGIPGSSASCSIAKPVWLAPPAERTCDPSVVRLNGLRRCATCRGLDEPLRPLLFEPNDASLATASRASACPRLDGRCRGPDSVHRLYEGRDHAA